MGKYRKKPVVIQAVQITGGCAEAMTEHFGEEPGKKYGYIGSTENEEFGMWIETLEGKMTASFGDYIIRGVEGEYYSCREDIFNKTYEFVTE